MIKVDTRYFGEIMIEEEKVLHFEQGIPGFDEYKEYTILYDSEEDGEPFISWQQCITEKGLAFPVVSPFRVAEEYSPIVEDALLERLGEFTEEDLVILLMATVPADAKKATVNMKAPIIINTKNRQAMQVIVENEDYLVKYPLVKKGE